MIDYDNIYEISTIAGDNWWIPESEYNRIMNMVGNDIVRDECRFINFNTLSGSEVTVRVGAINILQHSTEEQREISKAQNKKYADEHKEF